MPILNFKFELCDAIMYSAIHVLYSTQDIIINLWRDYTGIQSICTVGRITLFLDFVGCINSSEM